MVKKPTITEKIRFNTYRWYGHIQRMEENRLPIKVLYMNWEMTRLKGRPRIRWQDEVREDERLVGGKGCKERVYKREIEEAPEKSKESSQSAHANGMNEK